MSTRPHRVVVSTVTAHTAEGSARLIAGIRRLDTATIIVLSIDGTPCAADRVVRPDELLVDHDELRRRLGRTTPSEAAMALLPEVARLALREHPEILIIDSAIEVLGRLDGLDRVGSESIRLVPRALVPPPTDDRHPNLGELHEAGGYLPTILAVSSGADDLLSWWSVETSRSPGMRGALLDIAVTWVETTTCRSPGHGLNPSRIHASSVVHSSPTGFEIDGYPLATIDTSGHDPTIPHRLTPYLGARARLGDHPILADIMAERDRELVRTTAPPSRRDARTWLYAEALHRHEILNLSEPPDPCTTEFDNWLRSPSERPDGISRAAIGLWWHRPDLQAAFPEPDLGPVNRRGFLRWIHRDGVRQEGLDPAWFPSPYQPACPVTSPGVDLAGYINAELGVGEIARLIALALDLNGTPTSLQTIGGSANRVRSEIVPDEEPRHAIEILCVNADRIADVMESRGRDPESVHTIGVFFWETDVATVEMRRGMAVVNEIWAGSRYVADNLRGWTDKPVHVVPIPVVVPPPEGDGRSLLGVEPGRPAILFAYDFHSVIQRKNPEALIEVFRRTVRPEEGPVLILKSINGDRVPDQLDRLRWMTRDRHDIRIIDRYTTPGELTSMISAADIYASLHRSEGFGITIAHAMAVGTPVLCTAGSGPADFISSDVATIIAGNKVRVGEGAHPYPPDGTWWEPDLVAAATGLRQLLDDHDLARSQATAATAAIATHSLDITAAFLTERLAAPGHPNHEQP